MSNNNKTNETNKKSMNTSAAALFDVERHHLNLAYKIINVVASESNSLASVIAASGAKNFGPACIWLDDKKARVLVPCVEGVTTEAVESKLAALVADANRKAAAVLPAMAKRGAGRTEAESASAAVAAIAAYCAEIEEEARKKAEKIAARRDKAVSEITAYLKTQGMNDEEAAATATRLRWVKGAKDSAGRYCFKNADLVRALFARHAADIAALDAQPAATEETTPANDQQPLEEAANI